MSNGLVLSVFPGIDLLGRAFEEEGYCIVRGPDLLWGGDIRTFHPPAGVFEGIIGGPPCKGESNLAALNRQQGETMVGEFWRVVSEAQPKWWVMEAVVDHSRRCTCDWGDGEYGPRGGSAWGSPAIHIKTCSSQIPHTLALNPRWLGEKQSRRRFFHSNLNLEAHVEVALFEHPEWKHAVLAVHGGREGSVLRGMATYTWVEMCELQGLPADFDLPPFTRAGKREALGNGVPMVMGRAIAQAVRRAT